MQPPVKVIQQVTFWFADLNQLDGVEATLGQLDSLGYGHVSLGLRAHLARINGDLPEEVECRSRLVEMLPDHPGSVPALKEYATLLERLRLFPESEALRQRIASVTSTSTGRSVYASASVRKANRSDEK